MVSALTLSNDQAYDLIIEIASGVRCLRSRRSPNELNRDLTLDEIADWISGHVFELG